MGGAVSPTLSWTHYRYLLAIGTGFALIGHKYKIVINNHTYKKER